MPNTEFFTLKRVHTTDMEFVKNFTPPDFQVKNGEIYTAGNKFYTAAGSDGIDKFHLCHTMI